MERFQRTLFIFRRDLRLEDNTGLIHALTSSQKVIPAFIFTPEQINQNPYRSDASLQFLIESLEGLDQNLKEQGGQLYLFFGKPEEVVQKLIQEKHLDHVVANRDYTPYSQKRDEEIQKVCKAHKLSFEIIDDALLHPPEETVKKSGSSYEIFTPYYRRASKFPVALPQSNCSKNYFSEPIASAESKALYSKLLPIRSSSLAVKGGREEAEKKLMKLGEFASYSKERDFPALQKTTQLSAYLKYTLLSPREVYHAIAAHFGADHELIRALYWRDFFTMIAFYSPHVFKGAFHKKFNQLSWNSNIEAFQKWCEGRTGFPIVDAGMRQLHQTGFMHNRLRLITASFLVKDLHINWQWGEKYFAQKLIDYDPALNNGNWQWVASTGCDAQPYFRIFNPWSQQKKFDPECLYIKKWIPELTDLSSETIHHWNERSRRPSNFTYPEPIIDHTQEAKQALTRYKKTAYGERE